MKKTFSLLLGFSLFLGACGNGNSNRTGDSTEPLFYKYITAEFSMDAPIDWETVKAFDSSYPDEVRVAFKNNVKDSDFTANVNVIRESIDGIQTNSDLAQKKLSDHEDTLINFNLISQEEVTLKIGNLDSPSLLTHFEGKQNPSDSKLEYLQVYLTKGDYSWTATATFRQGEDPFVVEALETMLNSFTLR